MDENVLLLLSGGIVAPISHVTGNYSTSNVVIYDGAVFRDDPTDILAVPGVSGGSATMYGTGGGVQMYAGYAKAINSSGTESSTPAAYASDLITHTAPRYLGKQRSLWSFARTISGVAAFTHVCWADLIQCTLSHAPWRVGMTPTELPA